MDIDKAMRDYKVALQNYTENPCAYNAIVLATREAVAEEIGSYAKQASDAGVSYHG